MYKRGGINSVTCTFDAFLQLGSLQCVREWVTLQANVDGSLKV
jgi:hypothetical protein